MIRYFPEGGIVQVMVVSLFHGSLIEEPGRVLATGISMTEAAKTYGTITVEVGS